MAEDSFPRVAALLNSSSLSPEQTAIVLREAGTLDAQNLVDPAAVAAATTEQLMAAGLTLGVALLLKHAFPGVWGILAGDAKHQ
jgi:hypothetical protein